MLYVYLLYVSGAFLCILMLVSCLFLNHVFRWEYIYVQYSAICGSETLQSGGAISRQKHISQNLQKGTFMPPMIYLSLSIYISIYMYIDSVFRAQRAAATIRWYAGRNQTNKKTQITNIINTHTIIVINITTNLIIRSIIVITIIIIIIIIIIITTIRNHYHHG